MQSFDINLSNWIKIGVVVDRVWGLGRYNETSNGETKNKSI